VIRDHKALVSLMSSKVLNRRLQGLMVSLQEYNFNILYPEGRSNTNKCGPSRQARPTTQPTKESLASRH